MAQTLISLAHNAPSTPLELRVHHAIKRCLQPGADATVTAVLTPAGAHADPDLYIKVAISHRLANTDRQQDHGCSYHPVHDVLVLSGGLESLIQGYEVSCPGCGYSSTVLHQRSQLQEALTSRHIGPSKGRPCSHLSTLQDRFDFLQSCPTGNHASTSPQHTHGPSTAATGNTGSAGNLPSTEQQLSTDSASWHPAGSSSFCSGPHPEPQAVQLMGLILANMAIHILMGAATAGARAKHKGPDTDTQRLLPWRDWAVRLLTEDLEVIHLANWVRPSFDTLIAELTKPLPAPATQPTASAPPAPSAAAPNLPFTDMRCIPVSLIDLLLAPPWVAVSEANALETCSLERTSVFLGRWYAWLQQHRPADAAAAVTALSNQGYMLEQRKAGLQHLLSGLLALDPVFKTVSVRHRLEVFLACAGVKGGVDEALRKIDSTVRSKVLITTHVEACAYCGLSASKLKPYCKGATGKPQAQARSKSRVSILCRCSHCLVCVCVPCMMVVAGVVASTDEVPRGSIGEAEAAEAAAEWPAGLCPWCQQGLQGSAAAAAADNRGGLSGTADAEAPGSIGAAQELAIAGFLPMQGLEPVAQQQQVQQQQGAVGASSSPDPCPVTFVPPHARNLCSPPPLLLNNSAGSFSAQPSPAPAATRSPFSQLRLQQQQQQEQLQQQQLGANTSAAAAGARSFEPRRSSKKSAAAAAAADASNADGRIAAAAHQQQQQQQLDLGPSYAAELSLEQLLADLQQKHEALHDLHALSGSGCARSGGLASSASGGAAGRFSQKQQQQLAQQQQQQQKLAQQQQQQIRYVPAGHSNGVPEQQLQQVLEGAQGTNRAVPMQLGFWCSDDLDAAAVASLQQLQAKQRRGAALPDDIQPQQKKPRLSISSRPIESEATEMSQQQQQQQQVPQRQGQPQTTFQLSSSRQALELQVPAVLPEPQPVLPPGSTAAGETAATLLRMHGAVAFVSCASTGGGKGAAHTSDAPAAAAGSAGVRLHSSAVSIGSPSLPLVPIQQEKQQDIATPSACVAADGAASNLDFAVASRSGSRSRSPAQQQQEAETLASVEASGTVTEAASDLDVDASSKATQRAQQQQQQQAAEVMAALQTALNAGAAASRLAAMAAKKGPLSPDETAALQQAVPYAAAAAEAAVGHTQQQQQQQQDAAADAATGVAVAGTTAAAGSRPHARHQAVSGTLPTAAATAAAAAAVAGCGGGGGSAQQAHRKQRVQPAQHQHQAAGVEVFQRFTQLMQALLQSGDPFARHAAGTLALGVAAGAAQHQHQQLQLQQQQACIQAVPAGGVLDGTSRQQQHIGHMYDAGNNNHGLQMALPTSGLRQTPMSPLSAGKAFGSPVEPVLLAPPPPAAAAAKGEHVQSEPLLQSLAEDEQQALRILTDLRAIKQQQQQQQSSRNTLLHGRQRQQQQQARDQTPAKDRQAAGLTQPTWSQQQDAMQRVQQQAQQGCWPAASYDWPWVSCGGDTQASRAAAAATAAAQVMAGASSEAERQPAADDAEFAAAADSGRQQQQQQRNAVPAGERLGSLGQDSLLPQHQPVAAADISEADPQCDAYVRNVATAGTRSGSLVEDPCIPQHQPVASSKPAPAPVAPADTEAVSVPADLAWKALHTCHCHMVAAATAIRVSDRLRKHPWLPRHKPFGPISSNALGIAVHNSHAGLEQGSPAAVAAGARHAPALSPRPPHHKRLSGGCAHKALAAAAAGGPGPREGLDLQLPGYRPNVVLAAESTTASTAAARAERAVVAAAGSGTRLGLVALAAEPTTASAAAQGQRTVAAAAAAAAGPGICLGLDPQQPGSRPIVVVAAAPSKSPAAAARPKSPAPAAHAPQTIAYHAGHTSRPGLDLQQPERSAQMTAVEPVATHGGATDSWLTGAAGCSGSAKSVPVLPQRGSSGMAGSAPEARVLVDECTGALLAQNHHQQQQQVQLLSVQAMPEQLQQPPVLAQQTPSRRAGSIAPAHVLGRARFVELVMQKQQQQEQLMSVQARQQQQQHTRGGNPRRTVAEAEAVPLARVPHVPPGLQVALARQPHQHQHQQQQQPAAHALRAQAAQPRAHQPDGPTQSSGVSLQTTQPTAHHGQPVAPLQALHEAPQLPARPSGNRGALNSADFAAAARFMAQFAEFMGQFGGCQVEQQQQQ